MNGNTPPQGPYSFPPQEPPRPYTPPTPGSPPVTPAPPGMTPPPPPSYNPPSPQVVPPPPPPEVGVRTLASDVSQMRQSGGMQPQPKTFRPEDLGGAPVFKPREPATPGAGPGRSSPTRMILIVGGAVAFLLIAAAVFYFFVRPILSPSEETLPTETTPSEVTTPPPTTQTPPTSETPPASAIPQTPPAPAFTHTSLFNPVPTLNEVISFEKPKALTTLTVALQKATSDSQPAGTIKEIILANERYLSTDLLNTVLPDIFAEMGPTDEFPSQMEQDFTAFVYYDKDGVWPGYVFKLKATAVVTPKETVARIEKSPNLNNFYLVTPGVPKATTFKDGTPIKDNPVRYLPYSKAGASFNYAWLGNNLVLSTSFGGFKEAAKLLGF